MWVKICANTNLADAQLAVDLGADALGFVFAPSPRQVTVAQVRAITSQLRPAPRPDARPVETVGVVQTQDAAEIVGIVREAGLSGVQLHGGFNLALVRKLREQLSAGTTIAQVLHWVVGEDAASAVQVGGQLRQMIAAGGIIDRVLLDAKVGSVSGGSGRSFDWAAARAVLDEVRGAGGPDVILAGGLRPENLARAVAAVAPWGVDVASGVEASPGMKDPLRLEDFIAIARKS